MSDGFMKFKRSDFYYLFDNIIILFRQVKTLCILLATQGPHLLSVPILPVQMTKGKIHFYNTFP